MFSDWLLRVSKMKLKICDRLKINGCRSWSRIWHLNLENKYWECMDKSFQDSLIRKRVKNIGRTTPITLINLRFKVKIYNNKPTNTGQKMIKWNSQAQWTKLHQLMYLSKNTPNNFHTTWGREKWLILITGKILIESEMQNIDKVLSQQHAGQNRNKTLSAMDRIEPREPLERF